MIRQSIQRTTRSLPKLTTTTTQKRSISIGSIFSLSKQRVNPVPTESGRYIFATGTNTYGQCGIQGASKLSRFNAVSSNDLQQHKIKMISCGGYHTLACTEDGLVYAWGNYKLAGQLGIADVNSDLQVPTLVKELSNHKIVFVEAGDKTSAAVTEDGKLFTWGSHRELHQVTGSGALGIVTSSNAKTPQLVESLSGVHVTQVSIALVHGSCITKDGEMFVWGRGDWGKLGNGHMGQVDLPEKLTTLSKKIRSVSLTKNGSALVAEDGQLYVYGKNDSFLLGPESAGTMFGGGNFDGVSSPQPLIIDENVTEQPKFVKVALGEHMFTAITENGDAWVWGKNIYPMRKLPISGVIDCSAARDHVAYVTESGQLFTMGSNRSGQLGANSGMFNTQDLNLINSPEFLPGRVLQVSCGHEYTACVADL